jgi:PBP1b-binding outer membrane lipoprotein LpoB
MKSRHYFAPMLVAICVLLCGCAAFQTPPMRQQSPNASATTQPQSPAEQLVHAVQTANNAVPSPVQPWVAIGCTVALGVLGLISHQNVKGNVNNVASAVANLTQQVSQLTPNPSSAAPTPSPGS